VDTVTVAAASTPAPKPPPRICPDPAEALGRARRAVSASRYVEAIDAFDDAVRARPAAARIRAERASAYLAMGSAARAKADLVDAMALTDAADVLANAWWSYGLAEEALHDATSAELAFLLAARHGSKAALAKRGDASGCPATFDIVKEGKPLPLARGWAALADARFVACNAPALFDKATSPRARACRGCSGVSLEPGSGCTGPGPWSVASGSMHSHTHTFFVVPLGNDVFYYDNAADVDDAPPVKAAGDWLTIEGDPDRIRGLEPLLVGRFRGNEDTHVTAGGGWSDAMSWDGSWLDDAGAGCTPDLASDVRLGSVIASQISGAAALPAQRFPKDTTFGQISTRRVRVVVHAYGPAVRTTVDGAGVHIRGDGCAVDVPLP